MWMNPNQHNLFPVMEREKYRLEASKPISGGYFSNQRKEMLRKKS